MTTTVVCYGLGPIGLGIARLAISRPGLKVIGAIDVDPSKAGRDLGELLGSQLLGVTVSADTAETLTRLRPDVVLHATGSELARVAPQLYEIIAVGAHVISTCEELTYPWTSQPQLAAELDAAARRARVTLLGSGINPGFVMDALPLMLTAPCASVSAVRVLRVVDAAQRRATLQRKVGAGLSLAMFEERVRSGALGHVGLAESLHMLATGLGWEIDRSEHTVAPVIAELPISMGEAQVQPGEVLGVRQIASGFVGEREALRLELRMYLGAPDPQDRIEIDGVPPVHLTVPGGLQGDLATAAIVVNAIRSLERSQPGLASMADIPLIHCW